MNDIGGSVRNGECVFTQRTYRNVPLEERLGPTIRAIEVDHCRQGRAGISNDHCVGIALVEIIHVEGKERASHAGGGLRINLAERQAPFAVDALFFGAARRAGIESAALGITDLRGAVVHALDGARNADGGHAFGANAE